MTRVASLYISWYSVLPLLEQHPSSGCPYPGKENLPNSVSIVAVSSNRVFIVAVCKVCYFLA